MFRLDYLSCALTVLSTVLIGRKRWAGFVFAGINSLLICFIGLETRQIGFIPANIFCIVMYGFKRMNHRKLTVPANMNRLRMSVDAGPYSPAKLYWLAGNVVSPSVLLNARFNT